MQSIFRYQRDSKKTTKNTKKYLKNVFHLNATFWGNLTDKYETKKDFYAYIYKNVDINNFNTLDAHTNNFPIDASKLKGKNGKNNSIECMQVIRDCPSISTSLYYYALFDSFVATHSKKENTHRQHVYRLLGSNNISACFLNDTCISESNIYRGCHTTHISNMMGGEICDRVGCDSQEKRVSSVLSNMGLDRGKYITFGLTNNLKEYAEMLECTYPSYFSG
jgi:hypothetical protein